MLSLANHLEIVCSRGGDFTAISALRAARRSPEPHLSPSNSKGALSIDRSTLKGYRPLSGSGNRMETIQLSHPRLCDNRQARLIGALVNGGPGADSPCQGEMSRSDRGGRVGEYGHEVSILSRPPAILKVNCPEGAREGGLGLWFLSHRWERNSPPAGGEIPCETKAPAVKKSTKKAEAASLPLQSQRYKYPDTQKRRVSL